MRKIPKALSFLTPAAALAASGVAGATGSELPRALELSVVEGDGSVELELIAQSETSQQIEYSVELTGSSTARHRGNTSITAGDRHVLSRLKTSFADSWCATVEVTEGNGARYTLTAGDCAQG